MILNKNEKSIENRSFMAIIKEILRVLIQKNMISPIKYEIPFVMPNKEKLQEYNKHLYNLDELIRKECTTIETAMHKYIQENSSKQRMILWRKWYPLLFRFKVLLIHYTYDLTLRETENMIKENISVRLFLDLTEFKAEIPSYATIQWWTQEFWEDFIKEMNKSLVIKLWKQKKIVKWRKSRTDTTVVEENVSYPTDSTLLEKGKKLIIKSVKKLWNLVWSKIDDSKKKVIAWVRAMRKSYYEIKKFSRKRTQKAKEQLKQQYSKLIEWAKQTVKATGKIITEIKARTKRESYIVKEKLKRELERLEQLAVKYQKVIDQTTQRVIDWVSVKMADKLISYVSDSATIICKWKENRSREIWQKLSITEVENGVISNWEVYEWNPNDMNLLKPSLENCWKAIGKIPKNNAFDRWYWDKHNIEKFEKEKSVMLHIPKRWKKSQADKKRESTWAFKQYQKFRSWWEWRISVLKRRAWLRKLRVRWSRSTQIKISWAILTDNLKIVA